MFWVLLKREILAHLITFRFAIALIVCLLLVVITTLIGIPEGTSQKPVNFDAVPKFEDQHHFSADFIVKPENM